MRNAIILSLIVHLGLGFAALRLVRIRQVRFVPREVYAVQIVSLSEGSRSKTEGSGSAVQPVTRPEPKPAPVTPPEPPKEEAKKEELAVPTKKAKGEKKEPAPKTVPSSRIEKTEEPAGDSTGESGAGLGIGGSGGSTGDMVLDASDFPFAYYLTTVKRKIAANWQVPGTSREAVFCRVYFRITRSGGIDAPAVETSSGNFLFDQAALRAVVQANPLPPLPAGFVDQYLGVHFSFSFEEE